MRLCVWAPRAQKLEVEIDGRCQALTPGERGYFAADFPALAPGVDYALKIDGRGPFPDPRSPWQPHGVFGASRAVDHAQFRWTNRAFRAPPLAAGVLYEMHPGTFTDGGTFDGAIARLPHLAALGVTHIEVMPVGAFPGENGWGYDGVDLFAPHQAYGGPDALKRFVDACHGAGIAVILDVVYNHLGPAGNFLAEFGPYFTDAYHTPWGPAVNLDGRGSDEVRRFICDNALMWLRDYHMDGLRLDAVHCFQDHSSVKILEQITAEVRRLEGETGRPYVLIAESDYNDPRMVRSLEAGGLGMDAQWSDDFHHALHALLTGERVGYYSDYGTIAALAKTFEDVWLHDGGYSEHRQKSHGRPAGDTPRTHFLAYAQNHDQIGNRPRGDRLGAIVSRDRLKIAAALVLASPFLPMIFQGEEWGASTPFCFFTDHPDEALGRAVRDGRRSEMLWNGWPDGEMPDPQAKSTFSMSRLDWREADAISGREMFQWHKDLIALRRKALPSRDRTRATFSESGGWLIAQTGDLAVAFNIGRSNASVTLPQGAWQLALHSGDGVKIAAGSLQMPPETVAVLLRRPVV